MLRPSSIGGSVFACLLAAAACGDSASSGDSPAAGDAATGGGTIDASPAADAAPEPPGQLRFVAMGDTGTGSPDQYAVGAAVASICETEGCDLVVLLGDNFYDSGVNSVQDPLWENYFELPYQDVPADVPFYAVLGNHDYGGKLGPLTDQGGIGNDFDKGPIEVEYTDYSDRWNMPDTFYTLQIANVGFMMLDTNSIMWDNTDNGDQEAWYNAARAELDGADWVFGAGHHPYLSNGKHGNAGEYESIEVADMAIPIPVPIMDGENIKSFFDQYVCGTVDMYFSGHDHNRQWVEEPDALCGAPMIVSGAGAKTTDFTPVTNESSNTLFQDDTKEGFAYIVIDGKTMTFQFLDADLNVEFERTITKP